MACKGTKWWGNEGDEAEGGLNWRIFKPEVTDEEIHNKYPSYYYGPGRPFAHKAWIKRSRTRVLVKQLFGLDI